MQSRVSPLCITANKGEGIRKKELSFWFPSASFIPTTIPRIEISH